MRLVRATPKDFFAGLALIASFAFLLSSCAPQVSASPVKQDSTLQSSGDDLRQRLERIESHLERRDLEIKESRRAIAETTRCNKKCNQDFPYIQGDERRESERESCYSACPDWPEYLGGEC